jgi:uncharacterized protein (UPF0335 family)
MVFGLIPFMMVAAARCRALFLDLPQLSELHPGKDGYKVEESLAATPRYPFPRWAPLLEELVTSRLRELIQQLGEAIHESVIESEQIAGVVQDIRKHGFDVLLMLEATIGLNEVEEKNADLDDAEGETDAAPGSFTRQDRDFLRSLRISVEGDTDEESGIEGE